jgi:hypothetical protein
MIQVTNVRLGKFLSDRGIQPLEATNIEDVLFTEASRILSPT